MTLARWEKGRRVEENCRNDSGPSAIGVIAEDDGCAAFFQTVINAFAIFLSELVSVKIGGEDGKTAGCVALRDKVDQRRMYHPIDHHVARLFPKIIHYEHLLFGKG